MKKLLISIAVLVLLTGLKKAVCQSYPPNLLGAPELKIKSYMANLGAAFEKKDYNKVGNPYLQFTININVENLKNTMNNSMYGAFFQLGSEGSCIHCTFLFADNHDLENIVNLFNNDTSYTKVKDAFG